MSIYPSEIWKRRDVENLPGIEYDETKKTVNFAEDYSLPADEIVAIEETLGVSPQGPYFSVGQRLDYVGYFLQNIIEVRESESLIIPDLSLDDFDELIINLFITSNEDSNVIMRINDRHTSTSYSFSYRDDQIYDGEYEKFENGQNDTCIRLTAFSFIDSTYTIKISKFYSYGGVSLIQTKWDGVHSSSLGTKGVGHSTGSAVLNHDDHLSEVEFYFNDSTTSAKAYIYKKYLTSL